MLRYCTSKHCPPLSQTTVTEKTAILLCYHHTLLSPHYHSTNAKTNRNPNLSSFHDCKSYHTRHHHPAVTTINTCHRNYSTNKKTSSSHAAAADSRNASHSQAKWALISDLHFHQPFLPQLQQTTQWILEQVRMQKPTHIICLGDLLNTRESVSVQALSATVRFVEELAREAPVHILLGNHDMNLKHSHKISSLDVLDMNFSGEAEGNLEEGSSAIRGKPNSTAGKRITLHRGMQMVHLDQKPVLMSAYHEDMTHELKNFIQQHSQDVPLSETVLFAHMAIPGAVMSFMRDQNGVAFERHYDVDVSKSTNAAHSSNPIFSRDLSKHEMKSSQEDSTTHTTYKRVPAYLSSFKHVFSGHFHHHHNVAPTVTYCGAPMQHHFGDAGDSERGMLLYYPDTNKTEFLRNPNWDQFRLIRLNKVEDERDVLNNIDTYRDKHVSIGNTFNTIDLNLERLNQSLQEAGAKSVRIQPVKLRPSDMAEFADSERDALSISAPSISRNSAEENMNTFHSVLEEYARENDLSEQLIQKGKDIIDKTLSLSSTLETLHLGDNFEGKLESIVIENFLSIQGQVEFPIDHMKHGVWYIKGDNGSGKSAVFEAVCWALFDRFLRSDMKVDYAINDRIKKNCRVRLRFSNGYEIERFRKYKALGGNGVKVYKDGIYQEEMERGHIRDSQREVENLLGIDFDTFSKSIILSDQAVVFLAQDARRRRDFIEQLLGMNVFDEFISTLKEEKREVEQQKTAIDAKITMLTQQIQEIDRENASHSDTQQLRKQLNKTKQLLDEHTASLQKFEDEDKKQLEENLKVMRQEWEEFQNHENRVQYIELQQKERRLKEELDSVKDSVSREEAQIAEKDKNCYLLETKIQNYKQVLHEMQCVTCEREVDAQQAQTMEQKVKDELQPSFRKLSQELIEDRQNLNTLRKRKAALEEKHRSVTIQMARLSAVVFGDASQQEADKELTIPEEAPEWFYNDPFDIIQKNETEEMRARELQLHSEQSRIQEKLQSLKYLIKENEKRNTKQKERLEQQISTLRKDLVQVTDVKPLLQFWEQAFSAKPRKGFNSLRGYMLNRSVQDLNRILKYYSKMLTVSYDTAAKPDLIISFDADFQVNEEYGKRSAGQRKRNQLVIFFSLFELVRQRSRFKSNFLMLDEIFDALDQNGQEDVQMCIRMLCNQKGLDYVFVISHSGEALENVADDFMIGVTCDSSGSVYQFEVDDAEEVISREQV